MSLSDEYLHLSFSEAAGTPLRSCGKVPLGGRDEDLATFSYKAHLGWILRGNVGFHIRALDDHAWIAGVRSCVDGKIGIL